MSVPSYWVLGPHPPPPASVSPPLVPKGGHTHLRFKGLGGPNQDDWRKSLAYNTNTNTDTIGVGWNRCAKNSSGAGGIGAPIYWRNDIPLRQQAMLNRLGAPIIFKLCFADFFSCLVRHSYQRRVHRCVLVLGLLADQKKDDRVWCASPISMLITYYLCFTNGKRKQVEEKATATLISKQTSFTTVRKHLLTVTSSNVNDIETKAQTFRYQSLLSEQKLNVLIWSAYYRNESKTF